MLICVHLSTEPKSDPHFATLSVGTKLFAGLSLLTWAIALGFLFFGDIPDAQIIVGSIVIVLAGLFIFHRKNLSDGIPEDAVAGTALKSLHATYKFRNVITLTSDGNVPTQKQAEKLTSQQGSSGPATGGTFA